MSIWTSLDPETGGVDVATARSWNTDVRIWVEDEEGGDATVYLTREQTRELIEKLIRAIETSTFPPIRP